MRQWSSERKIWIPFASKQSIYECFNAKEFIELLKKAPLYDFGNICISFDPNNILEFKYVKDGNMIFFDNRILNDSKSEYVHLRLLIRLSFPKFVFDPPVGILPNNHHSCSICQIDEYVSSLSSGKINNELKWVCLDKKCQELTTQNTLELCDIHFLTKYENDYHNTSHRMALLQKSSQGVLRKRTTWHPLFYFYSQEEFLEKYVHKNCAICNQKLGLRRWHCLECVEVSKYL